MLQPPYLKWGALGKRSVKHLNNKAVCCSHPSRNLTGAVLSYGNATGTGQGISIHALTCVLVAGESIQIFHIQSKLFQRKAVNSHIVCWPYLSISYQCVWQLWELLCKWGYPEVIANILRIFHDQGFSKFIVNSITPNPFCLINQISALKPTLDNYPFWKYSLAWQPKTCTSMQGPISSPPISSPVPTGCIPHWYLWEE